MEEFYGQATYENNKIEIHSLLFNVIVYVCKLEYVIRTR